VPDGVELGVTDAQRSAGRVRSAPHDMPVLPKFRPGIVARPEAADAHR
jgi:hypothetical protein